jgi:hypothetical protein
LAILFTVTPSAVVNDPPAYKLLPLTARVKTSLDIPAPNALHEVPFHLAILFTATPPAVVNHPPAYTLPLSSIRRVLTPPLIPAPNVLHDVPFHREILFTVTPPAVVNNPPAYTLPLTSMARAFTQSFIPNPNALHEVPFHLAILFTVTPPAVPNAPPAYMLPSPSIARASTSPLMPVPNALHEMPSHFAILFTAKPPAVVNWPPAYTLPLPSMARAVITPFIPAPSGLHELPLHLATRLAIIPPERLNSPPAYTPPLPSTAKTRTVPFIPACANTSSPYSAPLSVKAQLLPLYSHATALRPLEPDTTANILSEVSGAIPNPDTTAAGFPNELAASNVSAADPSFVVRLAVRWYRSPTSPKSLNAAVHTLSLLSSATCGIMYLSLADVPSRTVTALSKVIVVPEIVPRRITMSYVSASLTTNTYEVPEITLNATEKFAVLYARFPRVVHVTASEELA